ncbi:alpha/beta hydrolase [Kitasatospora sp. NPDC059827]|uniref:alpha/beta hydrolase n=1 Tax=Kitasatospora sp. NPDC059827 TaxID=3346964 RepID=UPI00365E5269
MDWACRTRGAGCRIPSTAPTLVLQGGCDPLVRAASARAVAAAIPGARLCVVSGVGHAGVHG